MQPLPKRWSNWYRPHRTIGRFAVSRRAYSWLRARREDLPIAGEAQTSRSLFPTLSLQEACADLRTQGLHLGFQLQGDMVAAIVDFAKTAACARPGFDESFRHDQVCAGYLSDGRPVAVGDVRRPLECPQVAALFDDPGLLAAATDFLGYVPKRREARLYWSFAAPLPDDVRRAFGQTIDFHYDVPWFNAVDAYFYLTPSDRYSGAHAIYRQSARHKPARFKLASAFNDEKKLTSYYGLGRQHVIEGPAGFGFMVDPFGFHKAFAPMKRDRLMLQIRYS